MYNDRWTDKSTQVTGQVGSHIVEHLLKNGKHEVTAITRKDSSAILPDGIKVSKVDYSESSTLVDALRGQDALIITLSVLAPQDTQSKLIEAAAAAEIPWIIPNQWGSNPDEKEMSQDSKSSIRSISLETSLLIQDQQRLYSSVNVSQIPVLPLGCEY